MGGGGGGGGGGSGVQGWNNNEYENTRGFREQTSAQARKTSSCTYNSLPENVQKALQVNLTFRVLRTHGQ